MNLALIGNRGHQEYVFDGLRRMPDIRITAISTGTGEDDAYTLENLCRKEGHHPQVYPDYRQMLDRTDLNVVSVAGPFNLNSTMSLEALQRGLHVFCEKPVATSLEGLSILMEGYSKLAGLHFTAMLGLRYDPAFYTAQRAVMDGAIGSVRLLQAQKSYKLGSRPGYYSRRETYGGTIPWVGSHAVDWVYWFSSVPFHSVSANQSRQFNNGNGELEVTAQCLFELKNEVLASVSLDYLRPSSAHTHGDDRIRVVGTDGIIEVRQGQVFLTNHQAAGEQKLMPKCERQIFCDFIEHIQGHTKALLTAEDAFTITEACLLAQQSADEGRQIKFRRQE